MSLSQLQKINSVAFSLLGGQPINEAYHEKDREAKKELRDNYGHHREMDSRHEAITRGVTKNKEVTQHELARMAHQYASSHYARNMDFLPENYHQDREFFDKLNSLISNNADKKSKDCGISTDTSKS